MWGNYGRILAEYPFLKKFKNNLLEQYIEIEGKEKPAAVVEALTLYVVNE